MESKRDLNPCLTRCHLPTQDTIKELAPYLYIYTLLHCSSGCVPNHLKLRIDYLFPFFPFSHAKVSHTFFMSQTCTPFRISQKAKMKTSIAKVAFIMKRAMIQKYQVLYDQVTINLIDHYTFRSLVKCRLNHLGERGFSQSFPFYLPRNYFVILFSCDLLSFQYNPIVVCPLMTQSFLMITAC